MCKRPVGGGRRETAVAGGGARRRDPILGFRPQFGAQIASTRSARAGEASGGGGCGGDAAKRPVDATVRVAVSGEGLERFAGRRGARVRQQATQGRSLPPCAAPGQLHDDEQVTAVGKQRRRRKTRVRVSGGARCRQGRLGWLGWETLGAAAALNSPNGAPRRGGHASKACRSRTRYGGVDSAEFGLETAAGRG
jgi:hypothetical protein